jgi:phosphate-selective porin OprO/OprP
MLGKSFLLAGVALIGAASLTTPVLAASGTVSRAEYDALEQRLDKIEQQLDQNNKVADQVSADHTRLSTLEQSYNDVNWTLDNGRPTIKSGDGRFSMALRLRFQEDFAEYDQSRNLPSSVTVRDLGSGADTRRAFFGVEGKAFSDFWYEFRTNVAGSGAEGSFANGTGDPVVNIARVAYMGIPNFRLNVGVIEPVFVYGQSVSSGALTFMERPAAANAAASIGGNDARRGVELDYQKTDALMGGDNLSLSGSFTGQRTGTPHNSLTVAGGCCDEGDFVNGRGVYRFWSDGVSNIQIGVDGAEALDIAGAKNAAGNVASTKVFNFSNTPEINVDNTSLINTSLAGAACGLPGSASAVSCTAATHAWTYGFEGGANFQNFYVAGEYYKYGIERDFAYYATRGAAVLPGAAVTALRNMGNPTFDGWYVEGSWVITGEPKAYSASNPSNNYAVWDNPRVVTPFSFDGHSWGAWELAARYSVLNLNWNAGSSANLAVPFGGIRGGDQNIWTIGLNWYLNNNVRTVLDYMNVDVTRQTQNAVAVGKPNQLGQKFNVVAARLQFQF